MPPATVHRDPFVDPNRRLYDNGAVRIESRESLFSVRFVKGILC